MARTTATNFSGGLQFPYATAATDVFHKEDIQTLAQAVDQHDHTAGKGHSVNTTPANASITNAMLASDVARTNLLTNGGFEIWQRGNGPFTVPAAGATYAADRWYGNADAGSGTLSISRETTNVDTGSTASLAVTPTVGTSTTLRLEQNLADAVQLRGRTVSLSVRVRSGAPAGSLRISIRDSQNSVETFSAFNTQQNAWETLTVTATLASNAAVVIAKLFVNAAGTHYFDNANLVVGSQPADYVPLHPAEDLARCLRYYENLAGGVSGGSTTFVLTSYAAAGATAYIWVPALAQMAITPTATKVGTWSISNCAQPVAYGTNPQGATVSTVATAAGQVFLQGAVSAGLTLESNP